MDKSLAKALQAHREEIIEEWCDNQFGEVIKQFPIKGLDSIDKSWLQQSFLCPLLDLLIAYIRNNDARYKAVYLDERLRYAPHQELLERRIEFFRLILSCDEEVLLKCVQRHERARLKDILQDLHAPLVSQHAGQPVRIVALGDCLMNEVRVFLHNQARDLQIPLDFRCLYFSSHMGKGITTAEVKEFISKDQVDMVAMSFLTFEGIPGYSALLQNVDRTSIQDLDENIAAIIEVVESFLLELRETTSVPFLVHDTSGLPLTSMRRRIPFLPAISRGRLDVINKLNKSLESLLSRVAKCAIISESTVVEKYGARACSKSIIEKSISDKAFFHTSAFGNFLTEEYIPILHAYKLLRNVKVVLIDFDNTLWKGVMAEGDVEHYHDRQKLLYRLKEVGIVLVALSKNDPANIRWPEMVLKPEDFVSLSISWNLKSESAKSVAESLNLNINSFVFIDDNKTELELMRQSCPTIVCLDATESETWAALERLFLFPNTQETEESRARTEMYKSQMNRKKELETPGISFDKLMASLELKVRFGKAKETDLNRLLELLNRTNQFNTTTIRYNKAELLGLLRGERAAIYVADLEDKFGKQGLVAASIVTRSGQQTLIVSFVMSCRAMGFGLENLMLKSVVDSEGAENIIVGRFIATDRNLPSATLFKNNGFIQQNDTDWVLPSITDIPPAPQWFVMLSR